MRGKMNIGVFRSVRVRIALWSMAIIAFVVGSFGIACLILVPRVLMESVDRDLETSANFTALEIKESFLRTNEKVVMGFGPDKESATVMALPLVTGPPIGIRDVKTMIVNEDPTKVVKGLPIDPNFGQEMKLLGDVALGKSMVKQRLDKGEKVFSEVQVDKKRFRVLALPIKGPDSSKLFIFTAYSVEELYNLIGTLQRIFLILLPLALGATFFGGLILTRKALRPVREINQAASEVDSHDLSLRLPISGNDEFSELAVTINGMFDRLQSSFGELETSVEQQKRFVADASHELRTPLTVIRGSASWALQEGRSTKEVREALEDTNNAAGRMERLIANLLSLARSDANKMNVDRSEFDLIELFQAVAQQSLDQNEVTLIEVNVQPPGLTVFADRDKMRQVLGNLVENALRHTPSSGLVRLVGRPLDGGIEIQVCDNGSGIHNDHLPHVFERFYRVDDSRSAEAGGTGLGLALCQELVHAHGGTISIDSQLGTGTNVRILLPLTG